MPYCKVQTINLNKSISKKEILKDINLECHKGKITGVIGPNGCGKSSLFKVLSGLWSYEVGKVYFDTDDFGKDKEKLINKVGSFIELPNLYEDLTGRQNFEIMIKLHNIKDLKWYDYLINLFEMKEFLDVKVKKYSVGIKQKAGIIIHLIHDPDIIILDEPTNSLDITAVKQLHELLISMKEDKIIIISSHIIEEVYNLCDEVYIMNSGKFVTKYKREDAENIGCPCIEKLVNKEGAANKLVEKGIEG